MAGSLTSEFLAVIVAVIAWYAPSLLTTVRHAAARQNRVSTVTGRVHAPAPSSSPAAS